MAKKSKITSKHIANLVVFIGILTTLCIMGYKALSNGIYVPSLSVSNINIQGLYLRLNNKFMLHIDSLDVSAKFADSSSKAKSAESSQDDNKANDDEAQDELDSIAPQDVLKWIKRALFVISYFEALHISDISFGDGKKRSVHYDGKEYVISTPELLASFDISDSLQGTQLSIKSIDILSLGLEIKGDFTYKSLRSTLDLDISIMPTSIDKELESSGLEQPTLYLKGSTDFHNIALESSSSHLYNLNAFKPYILKLKNKTLNDWLFKNIQYEVFKLHSLRFKSTLDKQFFAKLQKSLALDLAIEAPKVYLSPKAKPLQATRVILYMRDEKLSFLLKEPFLTDINLENSHFSIANVFTKPLSFDIAIRSNNVHIDKDVNEILQTYGISIPLKSVENNIEVALDINVATNAKTKSIESSINGYIATPQTSFEAFGNRLSVNNFRLNFVNNKGSAYMQILPTKINYASSIEGNLNMIWNLRNHTLNGGFELSAFTLYSNLLANVKKPHIPKDSDELTKRILLAIYEQNTKGFSEAILQFDTSKFKRISIEGKMKEGSGESKIINLPELALSLAFHKDSSEFVLSDIARIYPYSPILRYFGIKNGFLSLSSSDFESFKLNGEIQNLNYPLYEKNAKPLTSLQIEGQISDKGIDIASKNKQFVLQKQGSVLKIKLKDYNLNIDEMLSSTIPALSAINSDNAKKEKLSLAKRNEREAFIRAKQQYEREHRIMPHISYIEAKNMDFYINGYVIPADIASISMQDDNIHADITYENGVANVDIAYEIAHLRLNNFSDNFINKVYGRAIFDDGLFGFKGVYDEGVLKGELKMQNTNYKDLSIVQNILALIDTIPALITFKKPGFDSSGYDIKSGKVDLVINDKFLVLEKIDLVGSSIDVEGGGLVELESKNIDIILKATTLKTLGDIISKIPLVNYVILGEDNKFSTGIVLKGTLDNPISEVSIAEDLLLSPLKMVGRILKPVGNLLEGLSDAISE